ncbi:hypothetical protein TNCV_1571981 [Trichonephila clavipes]|uniref:DUF4371 domain-containing protein n=1 Tax=Trichonephila clavipes TaxID=2585209 RepID=A0A8X6SU84_TRICX|nr:hypothetical protein TNCV_1571981 [Trichonephila clavipes]
MAFGNRTRNFEPQSSDEDNIRLSTLSPNFYTTPTGRRFSLNIFNIDWPLLLGSLAFDKNTDVANKSILPSFVRYLYNKDTLEVLLLIANVIHMTADEMFDILNEFMDLQNVDWTKCIGISTDGAGSMNGYISRLGA